MNNLTHSPHSPIKISDIAQDAKDYKEVLKWWGNVMENLILVNSQKN